MEMNVTYNKNGTLILTGITTILLFVVAYYGNQILPEFHEVFNGFETELPLSTSIVMSSYKGWWLLPVISIVLFVGIMRRTNEADEMYIANVKKISIAGILLAVFISVFSTYAVYAPTLQ